MIIVYNLRIDDHENAVEKFSEKFPNNHLNYTSYFERTNLIIQSEFNDFYIRKSTPTNLDIVISIWIIGTF